MANGGGIILRKLFREFCLATIEDVYGFCVLIETINTVIVFVIALAFL